MKAFVLAVLAFVSSAAFAVNPAQDATRGDAAAGKVKSAVCAGCHGVDGNSVLPVNPNLAGLGARYIAEQLTAFKQGKRRNAVMQGMVAALTEQDMLDLAAHYAVGTPKVGEADPERVAWGQRLYQGGLAEEGVPACTGCHGPGGKGNPAAGYPGLSGQHAEYTAAQLQAFRSGQRVNLQMNDIAHRMSDKDIASLAGYIQGLH